MYVSMYARIGQEDGTREEKKNTREEEEEIRNTFRHIVAQWQGDDWMDGDVERVVLQ